MSSSVLIQPLLSSDVSAALAIIHAHDEDDGEAAALTYERSLENQFCVKIKGRLIGVTGYQREGKDVAWLSWHYVLPQLQGRGWGEIMLKQILVKVGEIGVRKMFISTSDYRESSGAEMLYAAAMALYEKEGFEKECYHSDYFEEGEGEIIYGKRIRPPDLGVGLAKAVPIRLLRAELIDETDATYVIGWEECAQEERFSVEDLYAVVEAAGKTGARSVFLSFPSTMLEGLQSDLSKGSFKEDGVLRDYYADGIHEIRYRQRN